jgi:hypothetical protein
MYTYNIYISIYHYIIYIKLIAMIFPLLVTFHYISIQPEITSVATGGRGSHGGHRGDLSAEARAACG